MSYYRYLIYGIICWCCLFKVQAQDLDEVYRIDNYTFECPTADAYIEQLYQVGIKSLNKDEHVNFAGKVFFQIIQKDTTLCDAYYFTGVALAKQNKHKAALSYYFYADSIATRSNAKFKEELAESALRVSNVGLARKKYEELVKDFPDNPNGYYGIGLTSTSVGDYEKGLTSLAQAEEKYKQEETWTDRCNNEVNLMRGILLTQIQQYDKAIDAFEISQEMFGSLSDFLANYAWATYNQYLKVKDKRYKDKCIQSLTKLKEIKGIREDFFDKFQFEKE